MRNVAGSKLVLDPEVEAALKEYVSAIRGIWKDHAKEAKKAHRKVTKEETAAFLYSASFDGGLI